MVLRVSRIRALVSPTASTQALVRVAVPDSRHTKLSMVRSMVNSSMVGALMVATTSPRTTRCPSAAFNSNASGVPMNHSRAAANTGMPAMIPEPRTTTSAVLRASGETVAMLVMSSPPCRSSASAHSNTRNTSKAPRWALASALMVLGERA